MSSLPLTHIDGAGRFKCPVHVCATCAADDSTNPAIRQGVVPFYIVLLAFLPSAVAAFMKSVCHAVERLAPLLVQLAELFI